MQKIQKIPEERFSEEIVEVDKDIEKIEKILCDLHKEIGRIIDKYRDGEEMLRLHKEMKAELICVAIRVMTQQIVAQNDEKE